MNFQCDRRRQLAGTIHVLQMLVRMQGRSYMRAATQVLQQPRGLEVRHLHFVLTSSCSPEQPVNLEPLEPSGNVTRPLSDLQLPQQLEAARLILYSNRYEYLLTRTGSAAAFPVTSLMTKSQTLGDTTRKRRDAWDSQQYVEGALTSSLRTKHGQASTQATHVFRLGLGAWAASSSIFS